MGAQGVALVLALLLEEIVATEYLVVPEFQRLVVLLAVAVEQGVRHDNLVEEVPFAVVLQRSSARGKDVPPGVPQSAGLVGHVLHLTLGAQGFSHRLVLRVVVHVAHDEYLHVRVVFHQRVYHQAYLPASLLTIERGGTTRRQVVDDDGDVLAGQRTADGEEATGGAC